jgi:hypothetical protein
MTQRPRAYIERQYRGVNEPTTFIHCPSGATLTLPARMDLQERFAQRDAWLAAYAGLVVYEMFADMPRWVVERREGQITLVDYDLSF